MPLGNHRTLRRTIVMLCVTATVCVVVPPAAIPHETASPALLPKVIAQHPDQLAALDSNTAALTLFAAAVGPSLGLNDAAGILNAKGLPTNLAKELGVAELSHSAHELMADLAIWQLADVLRLVDSEPQSSTTVSAVLPSTERKDWMKTNSRLPTLDDFFRLLAAQSSSGASQPASDQLPTELLFAAHRVAFEASQQATAAWWELYRWKDRIRQARGLARLCGTWQWVIHNHQNHQEQKTVMLFPPAGQVPAHSPLPAETVILGDAIYLRWEHAGRVQEDSLLFVKDGARIEGSFVNNHGGWGSITAKRTSDCHP